MKRDETYCYRHLDHGEKVLKSPHHRTLCRACLVENTKNWQKRNRKKCVEYSTAYYQKNKKKVAAQHKKRYWADPVYREKLLARWREYYYRRKGRTRKGNHKPNK